MDFLIIQETNAKYMFASFTEHVLAFQINFHHHKYFHHLFIFTFQNWMTN